MAVSDECDTQLLRLENKTTEGSRNRRGPTAMRILEGRTFVGIVRPAVGRAHCMDALVSLKYATAARVCVEVW